MSNNEFENFDELDDAEARVTLTFEDDKTLECAIIEVFPLNGNQYMALLPIEELEEVAPDEIFLYRYTPSEDNEELVLENIEDDDEYEAVAKEFERILDELEDEDFDEE